ncbi:MAG: hypothetical protein BVN29_08870 [Nitrospira sp. ST-bin5]|nr:MAG: hypothetical protein BVN29_08870 [Nitrospira sp. ST-bin5]
MEIYEEERTEHTVRITVDLCSKSYQRRLKEKSMRPVLSASEARGSDMPWPSPGASELFVRSPLAPTITNHGAAP